jgi:hypothetical protein
VVEFGGLRQAHAFAVQVLTALLVRHPGLVDRCLGVFESAICEQSWWASWASAA